MTPTAFSWDNFEDTPGPYSSSGGSEAKAEQAEPSTFNWDSFEDNPEIPWYKSYPAAAAKGLIKGVEDLAEMARSAMREGSFEEPGREIGKVYGFDILPKEIQEQKLKMTEPLSEEEKQTFSKQLKEKFPSEEGFIEGAIEKAANIAPTSLIGSGGLGQKLARTAIAATAGETVKELGGGETEQAISELAAFGVPGFAKRIVPTKSQKATVDAARTLGLSEEQIAPLIQSEKKKQILGKIASRGEKVQKKLTGIKEELGKFYENIAENPKSKAIIPDAEIRPMMTQFKQQFEKLPQELRKKIVPDFHELVKGPITGEKLVNFWQDVNYHIRKGEHQLGILKKPVNDALHRISPELQKDFQITNDLYARYAGIRKTLKPSIIDKFLSKTANLRVIGGMLTGYYPVLLEAVGEIAARKISTNLLMNPRFQNLSKQMTKALDENRIVAAQKIFDVMKKDIEKESPELFEKIKNVNLASGEDQKQSKKEQ